MDTRLVIQAQEGDEEAFAALAESVIDRFHGTALNILRRTDLADDATQQALVRVWRDLPKLRDPSRFSAWSYRILLNACYSEARRFRRLMPEITFLQSTDTSVTDGLGVVADRDQLERAFRRLSLDHRAVVVLHHYLGLTYAEVGATLDIPEGTVRSRLYRAMQALRSALDADTRPALEPAEGTEVTP